ncbi:MAG TPA: carboxypeptidase-like regulatory domain-containing protein [Vicinamibacterales bacterium]|jgi:protocatechuate 3,4-dioxygenase beta subunit
MPPTYTLKGRITDSQTGASVRNAMVKIVAGSGGNFGKTAYTNSHGRYKLTGVKPEKIIIEASLSYQPKEKMLTVSKNTTANLKLSK